MPDLSDGKTMAEIFAQIAQWAPLTPDRVKSAAWMLRSIFFSKMNIIYLYAEVNLIDRAEEFHAVLGSHLLLSWRKLLHNVCS